MVADEGDEEEEGNEDIGTTNNSGHLKGMRRSSLHNRTVGLAGDATGKSIKRGWRGEERVRTKSKVNVRLLFSISQQQQTGGGGRRLLTFEWRQSGISL